MLRVEKSIPLDHIPILESLLLKDIDYEAHETLRSAPAVVHVIDSNVDLDTIGAVLMNIVAVCGYRSEKIIPQMVYSPSAIPESFAICSNRWKSP